MKRNFKIPKNIYSKLGTVVQIKIIQRNNVEHICTFDEEYFTEIFEYSWRVAIKKNEIYVRSRDKATGENLLLHRLITKCPKGLLVDHKDGNGLNNLRENLRICTSYENQRNRITRIVKYKGVHFHKRDKRFQANIKVKNKSIHLGYYKEEIEAVKAYNEAALTYHGEFARLNVID